jgi:hypothetical protein
MWKKAVLELSRNLHGETEENHEWPHKAGSRIEIRTRDLPNYKQATSECGPDCNNSDIREVSGSNLGRITINSEIFVVFLSLSKQMPG